MTTESTFFWTKKQTPGELHAALTELGSHYPIQCKIGQGISLSFEAVQEPGLCEIRLVDSTAEIRYSTPAQASRAVGALLAGLVKGGERYRESTSFTMVGIMLDCSRSAVKTVEHLQRWMRQLALLGYNMVMLYTEDTYELPGEPYFGYQRGAYTQEELTQIDDYAATLNIELIPCIQTLGHCEQFLRHPAYADLRDTDRVMLIGEEKTYQLIDKMIGHWKTICRTNRIHIGMDEAQGLGLGAYYKKHGPRDPAELFNEHLNTVVDLCKKHQLKPMIWSDMYFALGSPTGEYYDRNTTIPQRVVETIPAEATLVYWDYYHDDKEFYIDWIARHRAMGKEPVMASGIWTWRRHWYDHRFTERKAGACIEACLEANVQEIFFTQWGDNGSFCDHDSAFDGMVWSADKCYGTPTPESDQLEKRFAAICGESYAAHILASDMNSIFPPPKEGWEHVNGKPNLWDDPFFETQFRTDTRDDPDAMNRYAESFASLAEKLAPHAEENATGSLRYAHATVHAFEGRYQLIAALLRAYREENVHALETCRQQIPAARQRIQAMALAFRTLWLKQNKPEGIEVIQARFGMIDARYAEMDRRVDEYIQGTISNIVRMVHCV